MDMHSTFTIHIDEAHSGTATEAEQYIARWGRNSVLVIVSCFHFSSFLRLRLISHGRRTHTHKHPRKQKRIENDLSTTNVFQYR